MYFKRAEITRIGALDTLHGYIVGCLRSEFFLGRHVHRITYGITILSTTAKGATVQLACITQWHYCAMHRCDASPYVPTYLNNVENTTTSNATTMITIIVIENYCLFACCVFSECLEWGVNAYTSQCNAKPIIPAYVHPARMNKTGMNDRSRCAGRISLAWTLQ